MKRIISFILVILSAITISGIPVLSSNGKLSEKDITDIIKSGFELYLNLELNFENTIDTNATPKKYPGENKEYYPGKGEYAKISTLDNLKKSIFTEEMIDLLFDTYSNQRKYYAEGDNLYYYKNYYKQYSDYSRSVYYMPEDQTENINIVYNRDGNAYVIAPYIEYSTFHNKIIIRYVGVYLSTTEKGVRISDISLVPDFFMALPESNSDEITLEEVQILVKNAYALAYFTKQGSNVNFDSIYDLSKIRSIDKTYVDQYNAMFYVPCKGFEYYADWVNIASDIFTDNKVNTVFEKANKRAWMVIDDEVYINFNVPQLFGPQYPVVDCKISSNCNGKAKAEVTLEEHIGIDDFVTYKLIAEFEKAEDGWRMSGGNYYDYLYISKNVVNPVTNDSISLISIAFVILTFTIFKRKHIYA